MSQTTPDRSHGAAPAVPEHLSCDVAIVGYGPVGITLAALLAQAGRDVVVVERFPQRYDKPRAGHFDGETMRTFQQLGIASEVELLVRKMNSYQAVSSTNEVLAALKDGDAGSGWHKSYLFHQPEVEDRIDEKGRALGVRVLMNTTAVDIVQTPEAAQLIVRDSDHQDGPTTTIDATFVIGADGSNSFVRRQVGITKRNLGFPVLDDLAIDFEYNNPDVEVPLGDAGHMIDEDNILTFGRWTGGRISRIEVCKLGVGSTRDYLEQEQTAWTFLGKFGLTPDMGRIARNSVYSFECSVSDRWRSGRVLLVGDAAHTTVPFMGQGVCAGIRDAANLAWKIDAVLAGDATDLLLDTYESERSPQATGVIQMAMAMGAMVMPEAAIEADLPAPGEPGGPVPGTVFPRLGEGIVRSGTDPDVIAAVGRPALQARVGHDGRIDLLENFLSPGWMLILRHPLSDIELGDEHRALIDSLAMTPVHVSRAAGATHYIDIDGDYDTWFQATGQRAFVVRPDKYVFGTAETLDDVPALLDSLARSLSAHGWNPVRERAASR
ncbi:bifunctional 3-(3-hydroxy-phenyl)propionate/3-hydroxycinnamic acid hydroxylase [Rhodococcus erythropolis]|uniref:bifunctional 3-(3-hydroxy-phenyl)propionate/3-hydroxycinnamic acid hydroxylase n=1 Tax=Rhodococcus erythropolis TaxID=1833 RepID=UPI001980B56A|nr:bifunctional 3-(3-hydroxy-phenyl)propionate/3-hydroxycinnamic acid hydroxylase [Rhodococcus erythropolis]QSE41311.1 bifunctional 3-(3-hydroxy-phenyl)propionate/3-hydroxycinnamic acid hydroxylase [Rhodococcus erythropolis]